LCEEWRKVSSTREPCYGSMSGCLSQPCAVGIVQPQISKMLGQGLTYTPAVDHDYNADHMQRFGSLVSAWCVRSVVGLGSKPIRWQKCSGRRGPGRQAGRSKACTNPQSAGIPQRTFGGEYNNLNASEVAVCQCEGAQLATLVAMALQKHKYDIAT
jgi:hypothetical protein